MVYVYSVEIKLCFIFSFDIVLTKRNILNDFRVLRDSKVEIYFQFERPCPPRSCQACLGKVCIRAKWPIRPELIPVSVAWSDWEYFYSPLDGMLVHRRVTPSIKFAGTHLYTWVGRGTVRVKCLAQEHNTMSPARARTRTARSGVEHANHEATKPPTSLLKFPNLLCPHFNLSIPPTACYTAG